MKAILLFVLLTIVLSQGYGFVHADHGGNSHANTNVSIISDAIVTISIDSASYETGDMINVSGSISDYDGSDPYKNFDVTIILSDPKNNIISISQNPLNNDGDYSAFIIAEGPLWKFDGDYTISVSHGSDRNASTTFTFVASTTNAEAAAEEAAEAA